MKLRELTEEVDSAVIQGDPTVAIENVEYDSRLVKKGSLFIAVKGFDRDGYDFVDQAKHNGAVAVMGERDSFDGIDNHIAVPDVRAAMAAVAAKFYGHPARKLCLCAVTGTNGKTTVCYLMKRILSTRRAPVGMITSQVYDTGKDTMRAERTTPESLDVQRLLSLMAKNGCADAVVEVSSHALVLKRVDRIRFRVAVYTNLTRDHLDFHETMESYLTAKASLLDRLDSESCHAVINRDVPEFESLMGRPDCSYVSYSLEDRTADVHCAKYDIRPGRTEFVLVTPVGQQTLSIKLPGRFNLINAVAAAAGSLAAGADLKTITHGLETAQPVPGRFNHVDAGQPFAIYVDYAHTPDAIARLCQSAREIATGRLLLLFGCGGNRDRGKRPMMGEVATTYADHAVVTSDNPRSEDALAIIDDIKPGLKGNNYEICPDRAEAIQTILQKAGPDDVVLLAGKGDENYQEIKGVKHPFSDTDRARKVLAELGYTGEETRQEH
ncbi:MAG: UDP-N-acetylmuramoyl-L-alanyl-D-glutamate--2,6-diaminopimelate ligase [Candidatus Zixiibacteriota bacterium]|nr:MAG: UDP-N-acetylmuramoyl-L-alanyl-D-glutamate--2,6-diaminopimelate ligase [candidate division Zixibacteria bacterium]